MNSKVLYQKCLGLIDMLCRKPTYDMQHRLFIIFSLKKIGFAIEQILPLKA